MERQPTEHELTLLDTCPESLDEKIAWLSETLTVVAFVATQQMASLTDDACGELYYMLHAALPRIKLMDALNVDYDEEIQFHEDSGSHVREASISAGEMHFEIRKVGTQPIELTFSGEEPENLRDLLMLSSLIDRIAATVLVWN